MPDPGSAAEARDIHGGRVALAAAVILAILGAVVLAVRGLLALWHLPVAAGANSPLYFQPASPLLQTAPQDERRAYFADKERTLHGSGPGHQPIEAAMERLTKGGGPR